MVMTSDAMVKTDIPYKKIFFLPRISAILPNGTRNSADESR
jgi:hypothetical protein